MKLETERGEGSARGGRGRGEGVGPGEVQKVVKAIDLCGKAGVNAEGLTGGSGGTTIRPGTAAAILEPRL